MGDDSGEDAQPVRPPVRGDDADLEDPVVGLRVGEDAEAAGDGADVSEEHATRLAVEPQLAVDFDLHMAPGGFHGARAAPEKGGRPATTLGRALHAPPDPAA